MIATTGFSDYGSAVATAASGHADGSQAELELLSNHSIAFVNSSAPASRARLATQFNRRRQRRQRRMEPLWSPAVATGGNRWQHLRDPEGLDGVPVA
jgi:hypothetical protein